MFNCPCHSGKEYKSCCKPFHEGVLPPHAVQLMRSRYSAYALQLADYILATTHPENLRINQDKNEILHFCKMTRFDNLKIVEENEEETKATVTFTAYLTQNGSDATFTEKSLFFKVNGKWLYHVVLPQ